MLTIPYADYSPPTELPEGLAWLRGQHEQGAGGYQHWQMLAAFTSKKSLAQVKELFGVTSHCELSRSQSAEDYVWKLDTRVEGSQFELGAKPIRRNSATDWESVW